MALALWLMAVQGALGAFDTIYYHELQARLPAGGARARPELMLHALRDFIYAALFGTLPFVAWGGALATVLLVLLAAEIVITLADFAVEVKGREPVGVLAGERVTHGIMAIVYGAILANIVPEILAWRAEPTGFASISHDVPPTLGSLLALMAAGVLLSGLRDAYAALGLPGGAFPWRRVQ
jgi:hypothetical protein